MTGASAPVTETVTIGVAGSGGAPPTRRRRRAWSSSIAPAPVEWAVSEIAVQAAERDGRVQVVRRARDGHGRAARAKR